MSLKLYFLRHGQAGSRHEWNGDDSLRPLTVEGKKRMRREATAIWRLEPSLDVIISSPLVRALQTAEIVAKAQASTARLITDDRLAPGFGPKDLAAIVAEHRTAKGLMLVGHEPDFSETVGQLTGGGQIAVKKGALACIEVEDPVSLTGTLVWLIPPRALEL